MVLELHHVIFFYGQFLVFINCILLCVLMILFETLLCSFPFYLNYEYDRYFWCGIHLNQNSNWCLRSLQSLSLLPLFSSFSSLLLRITLLPYIIILQCRHHHVAHQQLLIFYCIHSSHRVFAFLIIILF